MDLLKRFSENWAKNCFAAPQQTILLAVSGGSDSMVLAHLFLKSKLSFAIAHCNFQLRGAESNDDEQLVRDWCFENNIVFHHTSFDTESIMAEWKKGVQETARILRYEWFEKLREEYSYSFVATAHNANDNAETVLMNLFKGTGISGMHGILTKTNTLIRPLLFAEKKEILQYVAENGISYREDASNSTDNYLRNAVRHNLIPVAESLFGNAVKHLNHTIEHLADAELLYNKAIEQERKRILVKRGNDYYIPIKKLKNREPLFTICFEILKPFGFTSAQIPQIVDLIDAETGRYISSDTYKLIRNRDFLILTANKTVETDFILIGSLPCIVHVSTDHDYSFKLIERPNVIEVNNKVALIDCSLLHYPLILRRWKTGDYFYPFGMGMKKKKLSKYFIDQKVPLHEKDNVWVLESNKRIIWVTGMRLDERFKITDKTTKILKVEIKHV